MTDLPILRSVLFGTTQIEFSIRPANRKTLAIHVFPDGSVVTYAPLDATEAEVAEKVKRKGAWILKQKRQFASYPPAIPARQYISGESLAYLGRHYRLKVREGDIRSAKLIGSFLEVSIQAEDDTDVVESLVQAWLRSKAQSVFDSLMKVCVARSARIGIVDSPPWRLLRMKKRWGSCTKDGTVILNPELIAAPKDCIEYVILHELCHLKIKNHSRKYYRLLSQVSPNWEQLRIKLNRAVEWRLDY
ncbi:M48 family metallopeptidase [Maridesulfovibrio bastinii]|uniref:M48 family metallopeptidase n=1 Tax=Maridesulfovibrio bastinii TaxID=47157 RepID=UPI0003FA338E|nr:SprT family zinc-dependent metalloprotease [Maridesulfovibrio bastinii]